MDSSYTEFLSESIIIAKKPETILETPHLPGYIADENVIPLVSSTKKLTTKFLAVNISRGILVF